MQSLRLSAGAFALCAIATACSDTPLTSPSSPRAASPASRNVVAGGSSFVSNAHKYRQQTYAHASNRSGAASLTARALLAKNGVTTLDVTTGSLDATTAPGNISKMQIKFLDASGVEQYTYNLNGLSGGRQTTTINGRLPHSKIQVQGNVRDIDPKRTDVVTITERVNKLPDIAVENVSAPSQAYPNAAFIVTASLHELNGDVGATTNCVLYVDGAERSRSEGDWVADGDVVSCAFNTSIAAEGAHTLTVKAESVSPADWDTANNAASAQITIRSPEVALHGSASISRSDYVNTQHYSSHWFYDNSAAHGDYQYDNDQQQHYQSSNFYGVANNHVATLPVTGLTFRITSGDVTLADITTANSTGTYTDYYNSCQYFSANNAWLQVCSYNGYYYGTQTVVNGGQSAGRATYYNHNYQDSQDGNGYYYHSEYTTDCSNNYYYYCTNYGTLGDGTSPVQFQVRVETGNDIFTASPTVNWGTPYVYSDYSYNGCWDNNYSTYHEHYCQDYVNKQSYNNNYVSF